MNLSALVKDIHLLGYECQPIKALRLLQASQQIHDERVEFTTNSNTNPEKITCWHCYKDNVLYLSKDRR